MNLNFNWYWNENEGYNRHAKGSISSVNYNITTGLQRRPTFNLAGICKKKPC